MDRLLVKELDWHLDMSFVSISLGVFLVMQILGLHQNQWAYILHKDATLMCIKFETIYI